MIECRPVNISKYFILFWTKLFTEVSNSRSPPEGIFHVVDAITPPITKFEINSRRRIMVGTFCRRISSSMIRGISTSLTRYSLDNRQPFDKNTRISPSSLVALSGENISVISISCLSWFGLWRWCIFSITSADYLIFEWGINICHEMVLVRCVTLTPDLAVGAELVRFYGRR